MDVTLFPLFEKDCPIKQVFISGAITNDPNYKSKFQAAENALTKAGFTVMNPAVLPSKGFTHEQYMAVTLAMLSVCDAVFVMDDWLESYGAREEVWQATRSGKTLFDYGDWKEEYDRRNAQNDEH